MPFPVTPITPPNHPLNLDNRSPGSLVPEQFDSVAFTYAAGILQTAVYSLGATVVATLTFSYTGADLTGVVRT
ncbi:MAG TPA: hypothetical protein VMY40_15020 [Anaerolineae bacterium]|nr:hypothetical protein [Anaerolineae bacterium]